MSLVTVTALLGLYASPAGAAVSSLFAPTTAQTGAPFRVVFDGTAGEGETVFFAAPGSDQPVPGEFNSTAQLGLSPAQLYAPFRPGEYELVYALVDGEVAARFPVSVEPATALLSAPPEVAPGTEVRVYWRGPAGPLDYIAFSAPDAPAGSLPLIQIGEDAANPVVLRAPTAPGVYQLRYVQTVVALEFVLARIEVRVR